MVPSETNCSAEMFERIVPAYDMLNHLLSFGLDFYWRRKAVACLDGQENISLVDLATGTGDVLIALLQRRNDIRKAVGLDISKKMLAACKKKLNHSGLDNRAVLVQGDARHTSFEDNSFGAVTMAFGIRNMPDVPSVLKEILRILMPAGKVIILEFVLPEGRIVRSIYRLYLRSLLPVIGGAVSGEYQPYRYLGRSIESFYSPFEFTRCMINAGFENVAVQLLSPGVACIYSATKP